MRVKKIYVLEKRKKTRRKMNKKQNKKKEKMKKKRRKKPAKNLMPTLKKRQVNHRFCLAQLLCWVDPVASRERRHETNSSD